MGKFFYIYEDIMLILVMYDISDTATRNNFIKKLRYFGLRRIQKSIFTGRLSLEDRLDLVSEFDFFISSDNDSIIMVPVCESCTESIFIEGDVILPKHEDFIFI